MALNRLSILDKGLFDNYLGLKSHRLAAYSFANIYIWKKLFDIRWAVIEGSLCIFFQDKIGAFLYLSPLARENNPQALFSAFDILGKLNKNPGLAHIENAEEEDLRFYRSLGFEAALKSYDYVCSRSDIMALQGNKFKSKRASYNYFAKNFEFIYQPILPPDLKGCLSLYLLWARQRRSSNPDAIYQGMLKDSGIALKEALNNYPRLGFRGSLVKIKGRIKAFTLGFELNPDTFCLLYETTDLAVKGLAQFIFSRFASELKEYRHINIMDDSGLANLKRVKLSYHPRYLVGAYTVRKHG